MKLSAIKKSVADGAGVTGQTLIYDSAVSTGSNTYLPTGLYGDSVEGTYAFTTNRDKLYLHTGQGWFEVSTINTNPSFTTGLSANYELAIDATAYKNGTATNIEVLATDPEGFDVTYTATGNTAFNNIAHIERTAGHDSAKGRFFTIEPKTQDSAGSAAPADGTLTITASDGINTASTTGTFSLTFDTTILGSEGTTFLSKAIGTGGVNNSFADKSTTGNTHSITATGNVSQGTFSPYSPTKYSWRFNSSNDDAVRTDTNGPTLGTGDFTVEFWFKNEYDFNPSATGGFKALISDNLYTNATNGGWCLYQFANKIRLAVDGGAFLTTTYLPWISTHSEWNHVAWVRNSGTSRIYINGYDGGVSVSDTKNYSDNRIIIGANAYASSGYNYPNYEFTGWFHDLRVVVGTPVYTGNFTPPIGPLTTTGGEYSSTTNVNANFTASHTKYQACNLPYIHYGKGSTGNAVQIVNGQVVSDAFSPYEVTASYSSSTHGGSAYFDGTGDYLSTASTTDTNTTAGQAWTVEGWVYPISFSGGKVIFDFRASSGGTGITAEFTSSGNIYMSADGHDYISDEDFGIKINQWYHMVFVHTGSVFKFYLNGGERKSTTRSAGANDNASGAFRIGTRYSDAKHFAGYISDFRFVVGTAVYTSAFTPPTAPLTEITNTKLLLNMTDAKVIDEGGRQNLVLYGDTKSHSGQPRVSGLSGMLFDGTGDYAYFSPKLGYIMDGNEDYTVEFYTYYNATPAKTNGTNPVIYNAIGNVSTSTYDEVYIDVDASNVLKYITSGLPTGNADVTQNNSQSVSNTGSFIHVAVVKRDRRVQTFVGGNPGTNLSAAHTEPFGRVEEGFLLGAYHNTGGYINSYISEFRITRGQGRYPFLPKKETLTTTTSFQDGVTTTASNVKILGVHTSTLTTNSGNSGTAFTVDTGVSASTFGPRGRMVSAYFDDSANAMMIHQAATGFGTGVFTVEFWMFSDSTFSGGYQPLIGFVPVADRNNSSSYRLLYFVTGSGAGGPSISWWNQGTDMANTGANTIEHHKWYHIAMTRESDNKIRIYLNGTFMVESSSTYTEDFSNFDRVYLGRHAAQYYKGWMSNVRMTSQVLYTKNFTPPATEIKG